VDCYVTTDAVSTSAQWIGNSNQTYFGGASGTGSDKNGRENFNAITASASNYTSSSAVGLCKALGDGWYLPAYEELFAMTSAGPAVASNNRQGASILSATAWSSTENSGNNGRYGSSAPEAAVLVTSAGGLTANYKAANASVWCAWRN
jgi:hypothetical protein